MTDGVQNRPLQPLRPRPEGTPPVSRPGTAPVRQGAAAPGRFQELFTQALDEQRWGLKFSAHARSRIQSRNLELTPERLERLRQAVDRAARKGARESLILVDDLALLVSVAHRTVITVLDGKQARENVFTNIDSAVIT
ncbi:TIGR02530 family flagellar biosynthesis protein [Limnochorda pilosa]|uniref:Flagellar biosynthesis protein n=1 Tax=Limnochorda pilosa TaxID=1555112 RepID=A0A0K2SK80_LIMPI|nr:TIGR02530 family flagellar biosynthesis protein [Limnochorda pilosa]BAS27505.1 flagellar biosynthesis protein [Limnochorda pilosa]